MRKLRIAKTGTTTNTPQPKDEPVVAAAGNEVPSPSLESFLEGVRDPHDRSDIVKQESAFGDRPTSFNKPHPSSPAAPDLVAEIRKHRS